MGHKQIDRFPPVTASRVRLNMLYTFFVRGSYLRISALRFERRFALTYTRCTSIPRSRNGVIALSGARLSVISM